MRTGKRAAARLCALCLCAVLLLAACREEPASRGDSDGWDSLQLIPGQYAYGEKAQTVTVWALSEKDAETIRVMPIISMKSICIRLIRWFLPEFHLTVNTIG